MRVSTAYFAGVGTVAVAIAAGLGGGLLLGDIMSPQQPKHPSSEVTRLEQRAAPQPIPAMAGASQPVPYTAAPQATNTVGEQAASPPQSQPAPPQQAQQAQPQVQQASTKPAEPPKPQQAERSTPAQPAPVQSAKVDEQPAAHGTPEDSYARARDADLKRDARRAEDKRKAERRQQWTDKRKWRERQGDDLDSVEASVRETTEARSFFGREPRYERREPGFGRGGFNLFDD
jgi:hypothetical protein